LLFWYSGHCGIGFNALGNPFNTSNAPLKSSSNISIGNNSGFGLAGAGCNNNVLLGITAGLMMEQHHHLTQLHTKISLQFIQVLLVL
jgi:hypothetical protein